MWQFSFVKNNMTDTNTCPICYENMYQKDKYVQSCCNHTFHVVCLLIWFLNQNKKKECVSCPMCRCPTQFDLNEEINNFLKKTVTRNRYKIFEKIYTLEVKNLLNACEVLKGQENKTQIVIKIMDRVFQNPLIMIRNKNFNKTVIGKINCLSKEICNIKEKIRKETYHDCLYTLEKYGEIYNKHLIDFK